MDSQRLAQETNAISLLASLRRTEKRLVEQLLSIADYRRRLEGLLAHTEGRGQ